MVYVAKIMLVILGLSIAFEGGAVWQESVFPKGIAGRDLTALALVLLTFGAFL